MINVYDRMKEMNIVLPAPPPKGGIYSPVREFGGRFLSLSGCGPRNNGTIITGKVGKDLTIEEGQQAARFCTLNLLANLEAELGDLNRIRRIIRILVFVNSADGFCRQPQVADGCSRLLLDLFGEEKGLPSRTAIGVSATPNNIACEIEMLAEYE